MDLAFPLPGAGSAIENGLTEGPLSVLQQSQQKV